MISGHSGTGIYITGTGATANTIAGNYIGVGQDGSLDLGNGTHGIWLLSSASDNTIGGVDNDTVNVIAYNGDAASEYGVYLSGANTDNNKIYRNTIYTNQNEGIKLAFDGANDNQIAPAIIKNLLNGATTAVIGTTESSGFVQLYDASADKEGQTYIGEGTADSAGTWTIAVSIPYYVKDNVLVATATSTLENTSEFSAGYSLSVLLSSYQKISDTEGNFTAVLDNSDNLGTSIANIGDLDGDGVPDLAAGIYNDSDGGSARGAVYVLFMNTDSTVSSYQKISDTAGNFTGTLDNLDRFGHRLTNIGDLDGDGNNELVVGAIFDDDGGSARGALYVLFMQSTGNVSSFQKISDTAGNFTAVLENSDYFPGSVTSIGDLDGDGVTDLAAGAYSDDDGGANIGAVYILFMESTGTVASFQKISDSEGNFNSVVSAQEQFGSSVANVGDLDGDGINDLAVGARTDSDGGSGNGAVYILFLNTTGVVDSYQKI
ncbi:hypothetical protein BVY03_05415, partial [bacterium K02(2017)]